MKLWLILLGIFIIWLFIPSKKKKSPPPSNHQQDLSSVFDYDDSTISDIGHYSLQMVAVQSNTFSTRKLMNRDEFKLFTLLDTFIKSHHIGYRLFSQVSMGEFLQSEDSEAYNAINGKRVDFLIIGPYGDPKVVIEYQGSGHYQQSAIERDQIKELACQKANIYYLPVFENYNPDDLKKILSTSLQ